MSSSSCTSPALAASGAQRLDPTLVFTVTFTVMAWASSFPAIRAGLAGFGPAEMAALRFALAGAPAALFLIATRAKLPELGDIWRFLVGGVIFIAGYALLLNFGQRVVPAGPAAFIINTNPIMTAVLAMMILGERFSLTAWLGTALSFAGIGVIALGKGLDVEIGISVLLILGAAFNPDLIGADEIEAFAFELATRVGNHVACFGSESDDDTRPLRIACDVSQDVARAHELSLIHI